MNHNKISRQLEDYLSYKHSLGFKLIHEVTVLRRFSDYTLTIEYDGPLTANIVLNWAATGTCSEKTMGRRIEVIRPFSKYVFQIIERNSISIYFMIHWNILFCVLFFTLIYWSWRWGALYICFHAR